MNNLDDIKGVMIKNCFKKNIKKLTGDLRKPINSGRSVYCSGKCLVNVWSDV